MSLENFFKPKSIAVIGASRHKGKIGYTIFKNLLTRYGKKVYPINPKAKSILGVKCYPSVLSIKERIDLAIIAVPAKIVPLVLEECGKKGIKNVVIITAGFSEVGNEAGEEKLIKIANKYDIRFIGPNTLGILDNYSNLDCIFVPEEKMKRPKKGNISFISQSGALAVALLDQVAKEGYGISKFISYGNATQTDESDLIEFLAKDKNTKVIAWYVEGIKNAKKLMKILKKVKKPTIAIKGGKTEEGKKAALSHTGSLAGSYEIYKGFFKQFGIIEVENLRELFLAAKALEYYGKNNGKRIGIITNGGGFGILTTDKVSTLKLKMAEFSEKTKKSLEKKLGYMINIRNPLDLLGDATTDRYKIALDTLMKDKNVDMIIMVLISQLPTLEKLKSIFEGIKIRKPVLLVSDCENKEIKQIEKKYRIPCFSYPEDAVIAAKAIA
ncbi:MAG: CoA-binding protein [Candidatus Aenigmarchaeota archaeon]|nr:CoA-binding protein [Candidatus Aenigmarchaeota archaeon]